jgi:phage baseplate assembly protein gpV
MIMKRYVIRLPVEVESFDGEYDSWLDWISSLADENEEWFAPSLEELAWDEAVAPVDCGAIAA